MGLGVSSCYGLTNNPLPCPEMTPVERIPQYRMKGSETIHIHHGLLGDKAVPSEVPYRVVRQATGLASHRQRANSAKPLLLPPGKQQVTGYDRGWEWRYIILL